METSYPRNRFKIGRLMCLASLSLLLYACDDASIHTLTSAGMEREFIVYAPEQIKNLRNVPVVLMLHGTGGDGGKFYNISQWREKADAEGFIAVFPSALTHCYREDRNGDGDFVDPGELHVTTKWAGGAFGSHLPLCSQDDLDMLTPAQLALADHPVADDVLFISEMLDFLENNYNVDSSRIYATGFSNGGTMTTRLALEMFDRFAAISASAGTLALPPQAIRPLSFVYTVGSEDAQMNGIYGVHGDPLAETLLNTDFKTLLVDPMLEMLLLDDSYHYQLMDINGVPVSHFVFANSLAGESNRFEVFIIDGLGHEYPNGSNHPLVLADHLWGFFKKQRLP